MRWSYLAFLLSLFVFFLEICASPAGPQIYGRVLHKVSLKGDRYRYRETAKQKWRQDNIHKAKEAHRKKFKLYHADHLVEAQHVTHVLHKQGTNVAALHQKPHCWKELKGHMNDASNLEMVRGRTNLAKGMIVKKLLHNNGDVNFSKKMRNARDKAYTHIDKNKDRMETTAKNIDRTLQTKCGVQVNRNNGVEHEVKKLTQKAAAHSH